MDADLDDFVRTAVALVAGIAVAVVLLCFGAALAYGARTPLSTTPTRPALAAATAACNWVHNRDKPPVLTGWPVLAVARGRYTAQIYVKGKKVYDCVSDGNRAHTGVGFDGGVLTVDTAPGPDQLGLPASSGGSAQGFPGSAPNRQGVVWHELGRAGSDVSAVMFVFADGTVVDATVKNGWYFAWWPSSRLFPLGRDQPRSVHVTASSRTITSPMPGPGCRVGSKGCTWAGHTQP